MEESIKRLRERSKKISQFVNENYKILNNEIIQSKSEIDLFNRIGDYAANKKYYPVYFKTKKPSNYEDQELRIVDVHYIHIYSIDKLKISIYYDGEGSILSFMTKPYYELYDTSSVKRFLADEEEELALFNKVISLL
ncbi:MAG: hypothetical protein IJH34_08220 [Romboutsia sp.]|nr:hypothetical protein [Romboutsia sp.]